MTDEIRHAILRDVLRHHARMEHDKCSCGRLWMADAWTYIDHLVAVYEEALSGKN